MPEEVPNMPRSPRGHHWLEEWFSGRNFRFSYAEVKEAGFKNDVSFRSSYHYQARSRGLKGNVSIEPEGIYVSAVIPTPIEAEQASFGDGQ